jgi:hypothetical protein
VQLANQHVVQQLQHVDHKIAKALLKKGTRDAYKAWNQQDRVDVRRHALARVARRGQIRSPQQHHHKERCVVQQTPGLLPSWAPLPALLRRSGCRATTSRIPPPGMPQYCPPPLARSSACTRTSCSNTTAPISRHQHNPRRRPAQAATLLPTRAQTRRLSTQGPRTTATANSFFRNSTASTRQLRGVGFPPASSGTQDQQPTRPGPIPSQCRLTQQLSKHWTQFKVLHQHYTGTRFEEQRQLNLPPKHKATNPLFALK